jgi:hypothetical protein
VEGAKDMPIFTFAMWSQIWDCLDPTPIHKIKIKPSESEPGGYKKSGNGSHHSFNQVQLSLPSAPMALAELLPPFPKLNPLLTDRDSENGSESKGNNEEDYQDALPQPFKKSLSTVSSKNSPLQHMLALA